MKQEYIHPKIQCVTLTSELLDTVYSTSSGTSISPSCARSPLHLHSEDNNEPEWIDKLTISTTFKQASHTKACFLVIATQ